MERRGEERKKRKGREGEEERMRRGRQTDRQTADTSKVLTRVAPGEDDCVCLSVCLLVSLCLSVCHSSVVVRFLAVCSSLVFIIIIIIIVIVIIVFAALPKSLL